MQHILGFVLFIALGSKPLCAELIPIFALTPQEPINAATFTDTEGGKEVTARTE